ncbi:MAG: TonB-dependent receptor plug domain-containing protein, partial [Nitrospira sp.]|nr:TonB-dependent receptor plug domain-containing protein [Nitrospira sp.]
MAPPTPLPTVSRFRSAIALILLCFFPSIVDAGFQGAISSADSTGNIDFTQLSLEELMTVKITSLTLKPQKLSDSAAAVFVITQDDIRRSGVTSIPEALRMAPGLNVAKVDGNKWAITARGFNDRYATKLLVLIDGRTIYTPFFAGVYWELQDYALEDIERIEVIRGPGAALWGANAVNGVINIITKKSADTQGALASTVVGTEEAIGTLRYGGRAGEDFHYRVYGKAFNRDTSYAPGGAHDDWRSGRGGIRADWNLSSRDTLTVHGNYSDGRAGDRVTLPRFSSPFGTQSQNEDNSLTSHSLLTNWTHQFGSHSETQLRLYYDQYRRDSVSIGERISTYDVDFQHRLTLPFGHDVIYGLGYRLMSDRFRTSPAFTLPDTSRDISLY